mmetsp:Transcript_33317/g.71973  ORF Transcript_33317/g.71973 Transcript_33317/m.71973 type:complete len:86 (+) Transcript_33317:952-1209(+)
MRRPMVMCPLFRQVSLSCATQPARHLPKMMFHLSQQASLSCALRFPRARHEGHRTRRSNVDAAERPAESVQQRIDNVLCTPLAHA